MSENPWNTFDPDAPVEPKPAAGMSELSVEVKVDRILKAIGKRIAAGEQWDLEDLTASKLIDLEAQAQAKKIHKTQNIDADLSLFEEALSLDQAFDMQFEKPEWRIKGLLRVGHITTVAGAAKAGKTSLLVNRVKTFVDGDRLFGEFPLVQGLEDGFNVGVWNFELTPGTMVDWFRNAGIVNRHRVKLINARGAGLYIQNEIVLEKAIAWCNDNRIEILEIDPLQAAFVGGVNSDEDAASFIHALERIQKESCVKDIILTTHMGHGAKNSADHERTIGSARWEGFADNMWLYKRPEELGLLRIDKGRDVQIEEFAVEMDPFTKLLTYKPVPRPIDENWNAVVAALSDGEVHAKTEISETFGSGGSKTKINSYIRMMIGWGVVEEWDMKRTSKDGDYSIDGTYGQKKTFVQMNEIGIRLIKEQKPEEYTPIPERMWFEKQIEKGVQGVQGG